MNTTQLQTRTTDKEKYKNKVKLIQPMSGIMRSSTTKEILAKA